MNLLWATVNNRIYPINEDRVAYFLEDNNHSVGISKNGIKFECKYELSQLESLLSKQKFFRLNQNVLVNTSSIVGLEGYFEDTSVVKLRPQISSDVVISKKLEADLIQFMGIRCFP